MAFVVEDGTGLADANALCSVAFADAYFSDRGVTTWAGTEAVKQGALVRAADYIGFRWEHKLAGTRQFDGVQALSYPRSDIGADGVVPAGIQRAVAEYALRALAGPLAPDPKADASGFAVVGVKKKVGPIETDTRFQAGVSAPQEFRAYPAADALMRSFLSVSATGGRLVRA